MDKQLSGRITTNPGIFNGKPNTADMHDYLASGMTTEEILTDFPYLEKVDIIASLQEKVKNTEELKID